jgi:hypothetical protein
VARAGLCGIVDCVQAAAADRPGERRLAVTPGHPGDHHLAETGEPVQGVTVDELTAQDPRPVALIKIDVQGAETMVLAGSRSVIEAHRPVIYVEVAGKALTRFGSSPAELIASIVALGYRPHRLTRGRGRPPLELEDLLACSADGYIDVLFLPG